MTAGPLPTVLHAEKTPDTLTFEGLQSLTLARSGLRIQGEAFDPHGPPHGPVMVLELFTPTWATEGHYRIQARKDTPEGRAALTVLGFAHYL